MSTASAPSSAAGSSTTSARSRAGGQSTVPALLLVGFAVVALLVVVMYFSSRQNESLNTVYGKRRGSGASDSVNGTSVLAEMFKASGRRVETISRLTPGIDRYQTIVWFPDDFAPPTLEQRQALEDWLMMGTGRVLIYVGRDYDAHADYYRDVIPLVKPEELSEFERRRAASKAEFDSERAAMPKKAYARWFTAKRDEPRVIVKSLRGPWADGVDASKVDLHLEGRLDLPVEADRNAAIDTRLPYQREILLETDKGELIVSSLFDADDWGNGQVVVVANGGFLLNYPLVNHEHRKLASRLIIETDPNGVVAFLESGPGGPEVLDKDPQNETTPAIGLITVWPLNAIMMHLMIFGVMLCLSLAPIFGRPKELPREMIADFGKHVAALGQLLARTRDRGYAMLRLEQYRQQGRRDSGRSHNKPAQ